MPPNNEELDKTISAWHEDGNRRIFIGATVLQAYAADWLGLSLVDAQAIVTPLVSTVFYRNIIDRADETRDFSELGESR
jgi:hypothetical protein